MALNGNVATRSEDSDLAALWAKAVGDYEKKTGSKLSHMKVPTLSQVVQEQENSLQSFKEKRHDGDKVDRVRSAFGNHLGNLQKFMAGVEAVGAAAGAFPPAMPVGLVFMACGRLLAAFAGVKADFDRVEEFFNFSSRSFDRLSIIEGKGCNQTQLRAAIVRVFSTHLSICAMVECKMKDKRARLKLFFNALWNMEDQDLAAAFGAMQQTVADLAQTVGYTTLAEIKNTQGQVITLSAKADAIEENIQKFRSELGQDVRAVYESNLDIKAQISSLRESQEAGFMTTAVHIDQSRDAVLQQGDQHHEAIMAEFRSLRQRMKPDTQERDSRKQPNNPPGKAGTGGKGDAGDKKNKALKSIRDFFRDKSDDFPQWQEAHEENAKQHRDVKESFIPGTGTWLVDDSAFVDWTEKKNPLLWIRGAEGIGKSFLVHAIMQRLGALPEAHANVAYFHFKEDVAQLQVAQNAFACATLQVAESNTRYAELVASRLKDEVANTWKRFFINPFSSASNSEDQLFLILDGWDEIPEAQRQIILQFLEELKKEKARVHVLITSQPGPDHVLAKLEPLTVEITKNKIAKDIKLLINGRLRTLPRLRKFSMETKQFIRKKVKAKADGMLYVEHMLRRLSFIGREGAVRADLKRVPDSLHGLYKLMLDECRKDRSPEQIEALKRLFAWLAFSKRSLSLAEATELVKLTIKKGDLDIEAEAIGRSARILELSGGANEESGGQDVKEDDSDDDNDEEEKEGDFEDDGRLLTFQERSLRQYFKTVSAEAQDAEDLRTPASAAHLTIFVMCVEVLMHSAAAHEDKDTMNPSKSSQLQYYAIETWYEHFNGIDPEIASSEEVDQVLSSIYRIANNENNVTRIFERFAFPPSLYPEKTEEKLPWYEKISMWSARSASLSVQFSQPQVAEWVQGLQGDSKDVLLLLARGHIQGWLTDYDAWYSTEAYSFATPVLKMCGRFEQAENDPLKDINAVADVFEVNERDFRTTRAIGWQLHSSASSLEDEDLRKKLQAQAFEYVEKAITMIEDDQFQLGTTYFSLANLHARGDEWEKAAAALDKAMVNLEAVKDTKKKELTRVSDFWGFHIDKGKYLCQLKQKDEALACYNEARKMAGDECISTWYLDEMTTIYDDNEDPDGHRLMDIIKSWNKKERASWLEWHLRYGTVTGLDKLYRAAKLSKETDIVLEILGLYEKTLNSKSLVFFNVKVAYADFYRKVLDDGEKAKESLRAALIVQPKVSNGWEEDILNERVNTVRMDLAGIIFAQFMSSSDPSRKEALLEELRSLPGVRSDDDFRESHIGMLLANMYRIMGPAREYEKQMQRIFQTCIDGLEDEVSWNDGNSLRLLAKVLSSLDGLAHDARITISAQFSVMDPSIHNTGEGDAADGEEKDGEEKQDGEEKNDEEKKDGEDGSQKGHNATTGESSAVPVEQADSTENKSAPESTLDATQAKTETKTNGEVNGDDTEKPNEVAKENESTENKEAKANDDAKENTAAAENGETKEGAEEGKETEKAEPTEDLADFGLSCDGPCDRSMTSWERPFYLCLICPNSDLCEDCHAKRLAWNRGEGESSWMTFCAPNHHYIKGPMKGWKGIKDGVIRIDDKEIPVKEWIKELKEKRWPESWERYWRRQGGLKDIDVEE